MTEPATPDTAAAESSAPPVARRAVLAVLGLGAAAFFFFDLGQYLSLETLKANRNGLLAYADAHAAAAAAMFIAVYIVQTAFSLPGGAVMTLAGGFLFGSVLGTVYVNIGATAGATLACVAARYVLRDWVERTFGDRIEPLQAGFAQNAFGYLLTMRLIPAFPFFLVNLVAGVTRINLGTYMAGTSLGIIPGSFVYAFAGRQLGDINTVGDIASPPVLLAFTLLGLLALMPAVFRKFTAGA